MREGELRELLHERQHLAEGIMRHLFRFRHVPQPVHIDVRMADQSDLLPGQVGQGARERGERRVQCLHRAGKIVFCQRAQAGGDGSLRCRRVGRQLAGDEAKLLEQRAQARVAEREMIDRVVQLGRQCQRQVECT